MSDDKKKATSSDQASAKKKPDVGRRSFLKGLGAAAAAGSVIPHIWTPNKVYAAQTSARGELKHLLYIRLSGGFRFTTAFNADVSSEFNPFGQADSVADGTEWGVGKLLTDAPYLDGENGQALRDQWGMRAIHEMSNQLAVIPCVDHEPFAGRADGNHGTGLERFQKGYVGTGTAFFTMINYGLRSRFEAAREAGEVALPAFSLNDSGMAVGAGKYAGYRPPVIQGDGFDDFGFSASSSLPDWAQEMTQKADQRMHAKQNEFEKAPIEAYMQTREATASYSEIFNSELLKIRNNSDEKVDGISNNELETIFGDSGAARKVRLALRLFHFGSPAVYLNQGGYDLHSGEENALPRRIDELNRLISGLEVALKLMEHPSGGTYWDHTMVVFGSEFGRTARGSKFNSARGSDHGGDLATRWMSMPFMGGLLDQAGNLGRSFGRTEPGELEAQGKVYSYRSVLKTLMDALGCDHSEFFPADEPFDDLFA
jgi:uncharacterized protein (DUF1501 family)